MKTGIKTRIDSRLHRWPKINPINIIQNGWFRLLTTPFRVKPDFLIIGVAKAGTTSLYSYICQHPLIYPAARKEIHYFSIGAGGYYKSNFPTILTKLMHKGFKTGEASTSYLFYPGVAKQVKKSLPDVKIIVILREPTELIASTHNANVKVGWETMAMDDAVIRELNNKQINPPRDRWDYLRTNYIKRTMYYNFLKEWYDYFNSEQILILTNDELGKQQIGTCNKVFEFLDMPRYKINPKQKLNVGHYEPMSNESKLMIRNYLKPYNRKLEELTGRKFIFD